ncbi:MAG: DUF2817 domain-containing protein [Pirellulales bacterium]
MMAEPLSDTFCDDYFSARQSFREAASNLGWELESHPIEPLGPNGQSLTTDVAISANGDPRRVLVVSSSLHGVEGFFGSAVQIAQLRKWARTGPPTCKCVFVHALNPYGFAWGRRADERNVDPNRSFLLPGEEYTGCADGYRRLDPLLNRPCPPDRWEFFTLRALGLIARHGMPALRQAVAAGQHEFPRGLFYAGAGPTSIQALITANMPRWLDGSQSVIQLDFHTGLGAHGQCKLLIDYPLSDRQRRQLSDWFGPDSYESCHSEGISYEARGGLGRWSVAQHWAANYLFACAEFGTYGPLAVLAGLRAENQAHHWAQPNDAATRASKQRLKELFCPAAAAWRARVISQSCELVGRGVRGVMQEGAED